jgi:hypothetical protein
VEFLRDKTTALNSLFEKFNIDHPADYTGRSMSVGDVVVLRCNGDITAHFVDSVGFVELSSFTGDERKSPTEQAFSQVVLKFASENQPKNLVISRFISCWHSGDF